MKKIYVLVAIAIIGVLSWSQTIGADDNIIDLGTLEYSNIHEQTLVVEINSTEFIDLIYISSDIDESSLYIYSCWFSPLDNITTYIFVTTQIEVDWWFINDTKEFIYQDNGTKQLYCINIDYTKMEVPPDPIIEWTEKYDTKVNSYDELQELFNVTLRELNETKEDLQERWEIYNQSKEELDNNSALMVIMEQDLDDLNIKYNETEKLWISATQNASVYQSYYQNLCDDYDTLNRYHNDLNGIYPIYIFFAILGTGIIVTLILKRKKILGQEIKTAIEEDIDTGYGPKASKIDKFTTGIIEKVKPKKKEDISPPESKQEPKLNIEDIHLKIDMIKQEYDVFQESTVNDIQGIQKRVDAIETQLG